MSVPSLFPLAEAALAESDPTRKASLATELRRRWSAGELGPGTAAPPQPIAAPGRPSRPRLVPPRELPRRRLSSRAGQAALVHALCHIEFNAINLALDAAYRFRDLPPAFYGDWLQVAAEEAYHFGLLREHLRELDHDYGDFPAHDGLWEMAVSTAHDVLVRMALVPRVLEARGLDVAPAMMERLRAAGNLRAVAILEIIERDEEGHVAIGTRWFGHLCAERGLDPRRTFCRLLGQYMNGTLRGPFAYAARRRAGFTEEEIADLEAIAQRSCP